MNLHPRYLQVLLLDETAAQTSGDEGSRQQPRLDDKHAACTHMAREIRYGLDKPRRSSHIANRAEQTGDDVEIGSEIEVQHVAAVKANRRALGARDRELLLARVHAF